MSCSPDPCSPNGYCNSGTIEQKFEQNIYVSPSGNYFCRCKPGFTGYNCQEMINNCINATCANGGFCINGVNSYSCDCPWPYSGRYCETKMTCASKYCKNNSTCVEEYNHSIKGLTSKCLCKEGFEGTDCSIRQDACHYKPCLFGGKCMVTSQNDYTCKCPLGRLGKNCHLMDICYFENPCKNNSTCLTLENEIDESSSAVVVDNLMPVSAVQSKFICHCKPNYTGISCDIYLINNNDCVNGNY